MLQEGFHRSFTELFILIRQQNDERDRAGPESSIWNQTLLENEPEKLEMLKAYLTKAEDAQRKGKLASSRQICSQDLHFNYCVITHQVQIKELPGKYKTSLILENKS